MNKRDMQMTIFVRSLNKSRLKVDVCVRLLACVGVYLRTLNVLQTCLYACVGKDVSRFQFIIHSVVFVVL